ncbi:MAG: hypothetical protein U0353_13655 [Sandaracinus sp.]
MTQNSTTVPSLAPTPITFTAFTTVTDPRSGGEFRFDSLSELAAAFAQPRIVAEKHSVPLYMPGLLRPGTTRANANVLALTAFVADVDDATEVDLLRALRRLDRRSIEYLLHTTHGHADALQRGRVRARVIIPLARAVPLAAWPTTWRRMQLFLGGICDAQCCDAARIYYAYAAPPRGADSAYSRYVPGRRFTP